MLLLNSIWGDQLPQSPVWQAAATQALQAISRKGMLAAVAELHDAPHS
jgi:hypothetical protein